MTSIVITNNHVLLESAHPQPNTNTPEHGRRIYDTQVTGDFDTDGFMISIILLVINSQMNVIIVSR
jgi:hypothetical protein